MEFLSERHIFMENNLNEAAIHSFLKTPNTPQSITVLETVDSTNAYLKSRITETTPTGTTVIANCQTNGRGRLGKSFFSPSDTGIYMSIALKADAVADISLITIAACVAVCAALESVADVRPQIKWVNDIFVNKKKVCGILAEAVTDPKSHIINAVVVGIGINITTQNFPDNISNTAGAVGSGKISRNRIAAEVIDNLLRLCSDITDGRIIDEYRSRLMLIGKKICYTVQGAACRGTVLGINEHGNLIVQLADGSTDVLKSGEISLGSKNFV